MHTKVNEKVKVLAVYDPDTGKTTPYRMKWRGAVHRIQRVTYYHLERAGREVSHIFHMTDGTLDFRLILNSETLSWTLHEVADGGVN